MNRSSTSRATSDEDREGFSKITQQVENTQEMQIVRRQDPAVNRGTSCEHARWCWKCATLKVKEVVHTVDHVRLCPKSSRTEECIR